MKTPQLVIGGLALIVGAAAGCDRAETQQETREAAAELRTVAARAGETLEDSWLTTKVQAQFFAEDDIKGRYINVNTRDGVVTVKGYVDSDAARQLALQIARNTDGVREVRDELLIGRQPDDRFDTDIDAVPTTGDLERGAEAVERRAESVVEDAGGAMTDAMVTATIQARYFLDETVKGRNIDVDTTAGVVTLRGEVASNEERAKALLLARTTKGVQRVEDALTVNVALPATSDGMRPQSAITPQSGRIEGAAGTSGVLAEDLAIAGAVRARLAENERLGALAIDVAARDGVVLLQGTVPNAATKQETVATARSTQGVVSVVDQLDVK